MDISLWTIDPHINKVDWITYLTLPTLLQVNTLKKKLSSTLIHIRS